MNNTFLLLSTYLLLIILSCGETAVATQKQTVETKETKHPPFVQQLEAAHKVSDFRNKKAIAFDIVLFFRGSKRLDGTITSMTNSSKIRLDKADTTSLVFDGEQVLQSPADKEMKGARFSIFTWQYFALAPYKLSDPGTKWEMLDNATFNGIDYERGKLSFEKGTGDAPDDWYILYKNPETNLTDIMAYIVTAGQSVENAEEEPHAVSYEDYQMVDGIPFPMKMKFWLWTEEKGIFDQLGEATISNVKFLEDVSQTFKLEGTSKVVPL